ncbi:MAG TPA: hypothetical protein PLA94_27285, partial [Myxococcota bacterium]|nr:hypothetical protein [Myxococcota bacterium]
MERHLELGMLAEAKELVDRGPSDDVVGNEWLPPRLRGPLSFVKEPLRNLLQWFFDEFPAPPDFKSLRPTTNDTVAWRLLEVLHRPQGDQGDVFLRCLAAIMGTEIAKLYRDLDGWTAHFLDLSAPGFPALGRRRWSQGVEVWLPRDPEAPERELSPGQLRIRIVLEAEPPPRSGVLYLKIQNVLMALSRPDRRRMLLSSLGSQVPLSQLFDAREADLSARWPRDELLKLKGRKGKPLLLVGCPGIGKSVFLQELSEQTRAPLLVSVDDDIPEAPLVLIDCPVVLDSREAKRMVKAIYWQLGEQPDAGLIVAARPEVALLLKEVREDFFEIKLLEPRPIAVMRQQAEGMLGWGGIEASEEG